MTPQELTNEINKRQRLSGPMSIAIASLGFVDSIISLKVYENAIPAMASSLEAVGVARPEAAALPIVLIPLYSLALINIFYIIGVGRSYVRQEEEKILTETAKARRIQVSQGSPAASS